MKSIGIAGTVAARVVPEFQFLSCPGTTRSFVADPREEPELSRSGDANCILFPGDGPSAEQSWTDRPVFAVQQVSEGYCLVRAWI
jgi:hypothetical protein